MEIRIFDKNNTLVGVADVTSGLTAVETGNGTGSLTVKLPKKLAPRVTDIISLSGVPYSVKAVKSDGDSATVTANEVLKLFSGSAVVTTTKHTGTPGYIIRHIISTYDNRSVTVTGTGGAATVWVTDYGTVYDEIAEIIDTFGLYVTSKIGADGLMLSVGGTEDKTWLCLGENFGNAVLVGEKTDISDYANRAVVYSSTNASTVNSTVTVDASSCGFGDGINDSAYGVIEIPVYKYANKKAYIYETIDGYTAIGRNELMRREGITALRKHRPIIEYEMTATSVTPSLNIGDRVTVGTNDGLRFATLVKRTTTADTVTLTLRA